jgi:hypothetical protein
MKPFLLLIFFDQIEAEYQQYEENQGKQKVKKVYIDQMTLVKRGDRAGAQLRRVDYFERHAHQMHELH